MRKFHKESDNKLLIIRFSSLGDIILTSALPAIIKDNYPQVHITYLTKNIFTNLVESFDCCDQVIGYDKSVSLSELSKKLKSMGFDFVIDLHSNLRSSVIRHLLGKPYIKTKKSALNRRMLAAQKLISVGPITPVRESYIHLLGQMGISIELQDMYKYQLFRKEYLESNYVQAKEEYANIGIAPGAKHFTKMYPKAKHIELANRLLKKNENVRLVYFGAKEEMDLCNSIISEISMKNKSQIINLCGKLAIEELAGAINAMDVFVANDSGLAHIADTLGKNLIVFFGGTHPKLGFAPVNKKSLVITKNLLCSPCSIHGLEKCKYGHFDCMNSIDTDDVIDIIGRMLDEKD